MAAIPARRAGSPSVAPTRSRPSPAPRRNGWRSPPTMRAHPPRLESSGFLHPAAGGRLLPIGHLVTGRIGGAPGGARLFQGRLVLAVEEIDHPIIGGDLGRLGPINEEADLGGVGVVATAGQPDRLSLGVAVLGGA